MEKCKGKFTVKTINICERKILFIKELGNYLPVDNLDLNWDQKSISEVELLELISAIAPEQLIKYTRIIRSYYMFSKRDYTTNDNASYTLCMHPSRKCNLSCKYCYAIDNLDLLNDEIEIETAKKAVEFMIYRWGINGRNFIIDISGSGEPLLKIDFIKKLSDYCKDLQYKTGKQITIMFPTNGTLITSDIADYLSKTNNILLGFSLDGNMKQNSNRLKRNGTMAYMDSIKGINLIKNRKFGVAVTITSVNEDVDEVYSFIMDNIKNVDAISMQIVRDYSDSEFSFYNIDINNLILHYKKLIDIFFKHFEYGDYEYIYPLLLGVDTFGIYILRAFSRGIIHKYRCGAGRSVITVDNKGNLYSCTVENGNDEYLIGDIYNGIDINKVNIFSRPTADENKDCRNCWASYICGGECFVTAKKTRSDFYLSNDRLCNFRKELISLSIYFAQNVKDKYPEAYDAIVYFMKKRIYFESVIESSVWAVSNFLKLKGICFNYDDLEKALDNNDIGVNLERINSVLNKYLNKFSFYEIENIDNIYKCEFPSLILLNKKDSDFYEYAILKGIDRDRIILWTNFSSNDIVIDKDIFIKKFSNIVGF